MALLAITMAGCTDLALTAVNLPARFDDVQIQHDISYGPRADEILDIYSPPQNDAKAAALPVVIFYYGGRWEMGSKEDYRFVGTALAESGFIVVIPDYRKYPEVKFPAFVEDAAASMAWTADHIGAYGGDVNRIGVSGHSAGAHIAALAITDPHYLQTFGKSRSIVKGFVGLAGPYDFTPDESDLQDMFGPQSHYPFMQVPSFVDGKEPPMLLLWGSDDTAVGKQNMDKLAASIRRKKGCVKTKTYPGIDHIGLIATLSWLGNSDAPILQDMTDYFKNPACEPDISK